MKKSRVRALFALMFAGCSGAPDDDALSSQGDLASASLSLSADIEVIVHGSPCSTCALEAQMRAQREAEAARSEAEEYARLARERQDRRITQCQIAHLPAVNDCDSGAHQGYGDAAHDLGACETFGERDCRALTGSALVARCKTTGIYAFATDDKNVCYAGIPPASSPEQGLIIAQAVGRCEAPFFQSKAIVEKQCDSNEFTLEYCIGNSDGGCFVDDSHRRAAVAVRAASCMEFARLALTNASRGD